MSRYVLTQEQLDRLQDQIRHLNKIHRAKQERIRELEFFRVHTSGIKTADFVETIGKMEDEIKELRKANKQLAEEINSDKTDVKKMNELKMLLEEERKLREYSEAFAKQVELKCAEESLIKDLTTELCQLQRAEIELESKKIDELQRQLKNSHYEKGKVQSDGPKDLKQIAHAASRENLQRNKQLKIIIEELRTYLSDLHDEVGRKPVRTKQDEARAKEVDKWLKETGYIMADINDIESMRKDLKHLRNEIEDRRKSVER